MSNARRSPLIHHGCRRWKIAAKGSFYNLVLKQLITGCVNRASKSVASSYWKATVAGRWREGLSEISPDYHIIYFTHYHTCCLRSSLLIAVIPPRHYVSEYMRRKIA